MKTRTRRQKEVLDYITRYIENHGYEPSYQMIARHLGVSSKAGIAKHVKALEEQGHLQRRRINGSFSLELNGKNHDHGGGGTIEWIETSDVRDDLEDWESESFSLPAFMLAGLAAESLCAFRVPDEGMADKNICEGDIVLIEKRTYVRDGDLVVVTMKRQETLLRCFYRDGADVELRAAAEGFDTLRLDADKVEIRGVYRSLLRPGS